MHLARGLTLWLLSICAFGQNAQLLPAEKISYPIHIDGNTPSFWLAGDLHIFSSTGDPAMISVADDWADAWASQEIDVSQQLHFPLWIESAWRDRDGVVLGWYHHEPAGVCGSSSLTAPKIGAVISYDGGKTIKDLGIVLESGDPVDCTSQNGFFAGGHGDFSVILDRSRKYFYFFFTNYAGDLASQGIVTARLAFEDRFRPAGRVYKYYEGKWEEPGIGGRVTPIFPARQSWQREDTDSFWGPAVHWNTFLRQYVMLLNRSCCRSHWPQEGIYITYSKSLADPASWQVTRRIMDGAEANGYYPQVVGQGPGESDSLAGETARLFVHGVSRWLITFLPGGAIGEDPVPDDKRIPMPPPVAGQ